MATTGTVGILRALLTADASAYAATMKKSAETTKAFGSSVAAAGSTAARVSPQLTRLEKSFQGDKLLYTANNLTKAITNIGGATKLTAAEQARANRTLTEALAKYKALGQQAPKAMVDLERATRRTEQAAGGLTTKMVALGSAVGGFIGAFAHNLLQRGISSIIQLGTEAIATAGKIDDMSKKLGISAEAVQGFSFAAEQSGTTIDAFGSAITRLNIKLSEGSDSTVAALKDLGLELATLRAMRLEDAFLAITDALAQHTDRVRIGTVLMGRGFAEILPAIHDGLRQTAAAADKMANQTVTRLAAAEDAWAALGTKATIVTGEMIAGVMGFIETLRQQNFGLGLFGPPTKAATEGAREFTEVVIPATERTESWVTQLARAQAELTTLTAATRKEIDAARALGVSEADIAEKFDLSVTALRLYTGSVKDAAEAQRQAAEAARQHTAAVDQTRTALEGLGLVTRVSVIQAHEDFADMEALVTAEGVEMDAFLVAMLPTLKTWAAEARRSGVEPLAELEAALNRAGEALRRTMPLFDLAGLKELGPFVGELTDDLRRMNEALTPEQFTAGRALEGLKQFGVRSRAEQQQFVEATRRMWDEIVRTYGEGSREATEVLAQMTEEQLAIIGRLPTYWQHTVVPIIGDALDSISRNTTQTFSEMLVGLEKWKDGFIAIWQGIKQAIANILADILQNFIGNFLKKMLAAMAGQRAATALGSLLGGTVAPAGIAGAAGIAGTAAGTTSVIAGTGIPVTAGVAIPASVGAAPAAGAAGFAPTLLALASNPITWGVAGGLLLAWGIGKKGWFRGGQEALHVNPARDRFLARFGPPGTGEGSGFHTLAALLTSLTGESGGGRLFTWLRTADTMQEFTAAVTRITTLLDRRGVPVPRDPGLTHQRRPMHDGGIVGGSRAGEVLIRALSGEGILSHRGVHTLGGPPALEAMNAGNPFPAVAAAARTATRGQVGLALPATLTGMSRFGAAAGTQQVTMHVTIQAWDRADLNDAFRTEIIPRLKDALQFNQAGVLTALKQSVGR